MPQYDTSGTIVACALKITRKLSESRFSKTRRNEIRFVIVSKNVMKFVLMVTNTVIGLLNLYRKQ